jgi:Icc-related predicted phosphoesterase
MISKAKDQDELNKKEIHFIHLQSSNLCYNMTKGGRGSKGYKHSSESLKKMRENRVYRKGKDHPRFIKVDEEKIGKLYEEEKLSTYEIANILNCDQKKISKILKENNIKIRNGRDNQKQGLFGFRSARYIKRSKIPWEKTWQCRIVYNRNRKSLGFFNDPLSCEIVYNLVKEELL